MDTRGLAEKVANRLPTFANHKLALIWDARRVTELNDSWWRHQMETFSALLALYERNSPVTGEFPSQRPVTRSFDVYFDLCLDKWLSKQSRRWGFKTPLHPLLRHCDDSYMTWQVLGHLYNGHICNGQLSRSQLYKCQLYNGRMYNQTFVQPNSCTTDTCTMDTCKTGQLYNRISVTYQLTMGCWKRTLDTCKSGQCPIVQMATNIWLYKCPFVSSPFFKYMLFKCPAVQVSVFLCPFVQLPNRPTNVLFSDVRCNKCHVHCTNDNCTSTLWPSWQGQGRYNVSPHWLRLLLQGGVTWPYCGPSTRRVSSMVSS